MPRSNRPRGRAHDEEPEGDLSHLLAGWKRTEHKRDGEWAVQPQSAASAVKPYLCPGCGLDIAPGTAHVVAWRSDGILGEQAALEARRHWHTHCWRLRH